MTPNDVQFIAVQSVEWLGFECIKERSSLKSGRTDILGVFTVKGGQELVTQLLDFQHRLVDLKQQLTYAQQQLERLRQMKRSLSPTKCQMCALMHKITGMLSKRQRKERVQAFQQIVAEINALQAKYDWVSAQCLNIVANLLMRTVMAYISTKNITNQYN